MMEPKMITALAEALFAEHKAAKSYHPFEESIRSARLRDAYLIQEAFLGLLMEADRGHLAGYKIALTSKAMQEMSGSVGVKSALDSCLGLERAALPWHVDLKGCLED